MIAIIEVPTTADILSAGPVLGIALTALVEAISLLFVCVLFELLADSFLVLLLSVEDTLDVSGFAALELSALELSWPGDLPSPASSVT